MDSKVKTLWLIPARSGSKGIPNKNLKPFCGESLVSRAVRQAMACADKEDTIFVSTDSDIIRAEATKHNISIPFLRPEELASDTATTYSVILHVIEEFGKLGKNFDRVVLLQPTSPFRNLEDIKGALGLWQSDIDMVVSVTESKSNPYYNLFETDSKGFLFHSKGEGNYTRRQDVPKVWEYNGAVYVITTDSLLRCPLSKFQKVVPFVMPASHSIDLDTPEDWEIAESRARTLISRDA